MRPRRREKRSKKTKKSSQGEKNKEFQKNVEGKDRVLGAAQTVTVILNSEGRRWGVRSVVVEFGVFGAPRFSVQRPPNPLKIGIWGPLDWKSGRPKNAKFYHDGSDPPFAALWLNCTGKLVDCNDFVAHGVPLNCAWQGAQKYCPHRNDYNLNSWPCVREKSVRANGPIKQNKMKGAFSLNNLLVGTVRPPELGSEQKHIKNYPHKE